MKITLARVAELTNGAFTVIITNTKARILWKVVSAKSVIVLFRPKRKTSKQKGDNRAALVSGWFLGFNGVVALDPEAMH